VADILEPVATQDRRRSPHSLRLVAVAITALALCFLGLVAFIFFRQHSMIYHPRAYDSSYRSALPPSGVEIEYVLPFGKQTAFYVPGANQLPKRIWIAFCGNASLALDWTTILRSYPRNGDGFLLVDYPGYGKNAGYATIDSTRATAEAALRVLLKQLGIDQDQVVICVIGHSLGSAAALDFAAHHHVQRVLLIAPFTTLREEAATVVGRQLARLLVENYDNRKNLRSVLHQDGEVRVAIFHGTDDDVIPLRMARELKHEFSATDFFPVYGGDHVTVLDLAREQIIAWMNR
jgi:uncharacterized protein